MIVSRAIRENKYEFLIAGNLATLKTGSGHGQGAEEKNRSGSSVPFVKENGTREMPDNIYPEPEKESGNN